MEELVPTNNAPDPEYHIQLNIPRNKIHSSKFHSDSRVRSRNNLFAKTLLSLPPLDQNYAGNMRPPGETGCTSFTRIYRGHELLRGETLVSPLLWAVHEPSSALSAGEKWFRYTGRVLFNCEKLLAPLDSRGGRGLGKLANFIQTGTSVPRNFRKFPSANVIRGWKLKNVRLFRITGPRETSLALIKPEIGWYSRGMFFDEFSIQQGGCVFPGIYICVTLDFNFNMYIREIRVNFNTRKIILWNTIDTRGEGGGRVLLHIGCTN